MSKRFPKAESVNAYARQAIVTRWHGATDTLPARVVARAAAGSVRVSYDYEGSTDDLHVTAALKLADKFGWGGRWVHGVLPNGDHVFTCVVHSDGSGWK